MHQFLVSSFFFSVYATKHTHRRTDAVKNNTRFARAGKYLKTVRDSTQQGADPSETHGYSLFDVRSNEIELFLANRRAPALFSSPQRQHQQQQHATFGGVTCQRDSGTVPDSPPWKRWSAASRPFWTVRGYISDLGAVVTRAQRESPRHHARHVSTTDIDSFIALSLT